MSRRGPELLCPAGNPEKLAAALRYGADAVYLAGKRFGMRAAADNFTPAELREAVSLTHAAGAKLYLALNVLPHEEEYEELRATLASLADCPPDGVIAADLGVIAEVKEALPAVEIHVSTQAGVVSAKAAEQYRRLGCSRVVLARELTLEEIREIRRRTTKEMELEVFIHGSMCVSFSGRCLLSNYFTGRDANRGNCAQPCRWGYSLFEIEEETRPGERLPVEQTERGTFLMSSRDLCMISHIPELVEAGVDSLKIEGRMKSAYYAAVTANAYRMALDFSLAHPNETLEPALEAALREELDSVSHREYGTGFFFNSPEKEPYVTPDRGYIREKSYIGVVAAYDPETGLAEVVQRNKVSLGEEVELLTPGKVGRPFTVTSLIGEDGAPLTSAPHPKMKFFLPIPGGAKEGDILRR